MSNRVYKSYKNCFFDDEAYFVLRFLTDFLGWSVQSCANVFDVHHSTIQRQLQCDTPPSLRTRAKGDDAFAWARKMCVQRAAKMTRTVVRSFFTKVRKNYHERRTKEPVNPSVRKICAYLNHNGIKCSPSTVFRDLVELNMVAKARRRVPRLSVMHKTLRVAFAKWALKHVDKELVLCFSDECWVTNNPSKGKHFQWCDPGEEPLPLPNVPHPIKIGIWIAIAKGGIRAITIIDCTEKNLNEDRYQEEIIEGNLELFDKLRAKGIPFQQDCHSAHKSDDWLEENMILLLEKKWPAKGADLSPVEQVNQWLKYRVSQRHVFGAEEIIIVREEFWKIPTESIDRAIDSFHERCKQVISAKGNIIKPKRTKMRD